MKLWNPLAAIITLMMSMLMAIIFSMMVPSFMGLPSLDPNLCLYLWPIRWITAYLLILLIAYPLGAKLADKIFNFNPDEKDLGFWNPPAFFITLIMSFIMAAVFGLPMGMPLDQLLYIWPLRWITAYLLITIIVHPVALWHAEKIFGFNPKSE